MNGYTENYVYKPVTPKPQNPKLDKNPSKFLSSIPLSLREYVKVGYFIGPFDKIPKRGQMMTANDDSECDKVVITRAMY